MAAEAERSRLARDMHDSLAKTVSGIGFAALALSRQIERDPKGAVAEARRLADDARQATREAREIITGLRTDEAATARAAAADRAAGRGGALGGRAAGAARPRDRGRGRARRRRRPRARVDPARGAAQRRAPRARVGGLGAAADARRARRADDRRRRRRASRSPTTSPTLSRGRHFGVTGMRERAQLAGGDLMVESAPGEGCVLSVWVPAPEARRDAPAPPPAPPPAPARPARRAVRYGPARRAGVHMAVIRVLLVDDNAIVRRGIASLLARGRRHRGRGRGRPTAARRSPSRARRAPTSSAWTCACRSWTASPPPSRCRSPRRS